MVSIFKYFHGTRRTYNDLRLDNIMVNTTANYGESSNESESSEFSYPIYPEIHLIDYGFSDKYYKKHVKEHIEESDTNNKFRGNMLFASERQMYFLKTSRKDDFISLFYLLIYMLNGRDLWMSSQNPEQGTN